MKCISGLTGHVLNVLSWNCHALTHYCRFFKDMVCVEARDSWQELFHLWHIRGQIKAFCHELSKQLDMRYVSPPMPIDLRMRGSLDDALREDQARARAREGITADSEVIQSIIQDRRR